MFPTVEEYTRRHASHLPEHPVEMVRRTETRFISHLLHRPSSVGKQFDSPHDALMVHVIGKADARSMQQTTEVAHRKAKFCRHLFDVQIVAQMLHHIVEYRMQAGIVGDDQSLQQHFPSQAHGREQAEEAERKIV